MNQVTCVWLLALLTNLTSPAAQSSATVPPSATAGAPESRRSPTPIGLTVKAGDAQVTLTWSVSDNATSYTVYRRVASSDEPVRVATGIAAPPFVDTGLTNGTTYHYWVRASNAEATSASSNEASATPQPPPPTGVPVIKTATADPAQVVGAMPVSAPTGVTAVGGDTTAADAIAPEGERRASDKMSSRDAPDEVPHATGAAGTVSGFSGVSPSSMQGSPAGRTTNPQTAPPSTPVNPTPMAGDAVPAKPQPPPPAPAPAPQNPTRAAAVAVAPPPPPSPSSTPAPPANPAPVANTANVVTNAPPVSAATSDPVVVPSTTMPSDPATPIATATAPAVVNKDATSGRVSPGEVRNVDGTDPPASNDPPAAPSALPPAPQGVSATAGNGSITLSWTLVGGATGYNLYRSTAPNQEVRVTIVGAPLMPPYVDASLQNGVTYYYKLTTVNASGESGKSSEVSSTPIAPPDPPDPSTVAAFRFLRQATWGPKPGDVDLVKGMGVDAFLNQQFSAPASSYPDTLFTMPVDMAQERFMELALTGPDQLRQRVAWALHKIWVVSAVEVTTAPAIVTYHRLFLNDAFGNFRDLMTDITLNPAMGRYLNMLNNRSLAVTGSLPNENYARELMQLFTLGIPRLDPNGTPSIRLSTPGAPVIAYTEQDVKELARILTGWTFGDGNPATVPTNLGKENYKVPMEAVARFHDTGAKFFLETFFPAGQTARQDLDQALDVLFQRSNIGPFISRQLIQQLVTSNPSPAYVADIATMFNGNGGSARGDLAAVVRAILTHPEAGVSTTTSGKLTEPALFVVSLLRALNASVTDHPFMSNAAEAMGQKVLFPPSVFSYFSPGYRVRGTVGPGGLPLGGPEFQILTTVTALERANFVGGLLGGFYGMDVVVDYTPFTSQAANAQSLVDYCSLLFMGGRMSPDARLEVINAVLATPASKPSERVRTALYLTMTAAQFQVDR